MAKGIKTGGKNWKEGQSGNLHGRPRESWAEALQIVSEKKDKRTGKQYKQLVAESLWNQALEGRLSAIKVLMERMEGPSSQALDIETETRVVGFQFVNPLCKKCNEIVEIDGKQDSPVLY